ncbi:MAG: TonB-dependent receptor [Candidatus Binatia bacterium]|nr:TonB-dependent receptor [Candidatus Binatia bacterium]
MIEARYRLTVVLGTLLWLIASPALAQDENVAPSDYLESIETPTDVSADAMNESDGIQAEADEIADGNTPGFETPRRQARVEEIVVSARKRDELLEDTPVSVTALSETTLREAGVNRIDDIQQLVPNLSFQTSSTGTEALVYIRGVGTPRALTSFDPGVGIYVDGVFLPRAQGSLLDVVDVAQIEVLRGPQGTLFGKNTVGGAVNFTTQKPSEELEAYAFMRTGNIDAPNSHGLNLVDTRAMLNLPINIGPLEDHVFMRLAFGSQNRAGYMYNELRDEGWNDRSSMAFLGSLRIIPHEDVTIDISGNWDRSRNYGEAGECVFVTETGLQDLTPGLADYCKEKTDPYHFSANWPQLYDVLSVGSWGIMNWDVGPVPGLDEFSVKAIGSWREQTIGGRQDTDLTPSPAVNASAAGNATVPVPPGGDLEAPLEGRPTKAQQLQGELQVNGSALDGRLNFVAGYFTFWETSHTQQGIRAIVDVLNTRQVSPQFTDNWTWAIYTQGSYDVLDWMQITGGIRYTEDKKGVTSERFACTPGPNGTCAGYTEAFNESDSAIFSAWSPTGTLSLTLPEDLMGDAPLDHLMGYFTYSKGFRGGGFNVTPLPDPVTGQLSLQPFDPETLNSYEVGLKALSFDRRLSTNLSIFYADYDDIQVVSIRDLGDPDGDGVPNIAQETLNAASATTKGLEFEALLNAIEGMNIEGSLGLFEGEYKEFQGISDVDGEPIDRSGETFNRVPEMQAHIALQYSFPIDLDTDFMDGYLTPRVDWYYQSKVHFFGPELTPGLQSGYNLLQARLSYAFNDGRTQFALWGQNLANERYKTNTIPLVTSFGIAQQLFGVPRSYGAELSHNF